MQAILFDVDGVLTHGYYNHFNHGEPWDKTIEDDLKLDKQLFKDDFIFKDYVTNIIPGKLCFKEGLNQFIKRNQLDIEADTIIDYWLSKDSAINGAVFPYIEKLRDMDDVSLFLATNQEHYRAAYLMNELGFNRYFDDIFYAADIGHAKPDEGFYKAVDKRLKEQGFESKPIFFDDHPTIIEAAQKQGWEAPHFKDENDLFKSPYIKAILR